MLIYPFFEDFSSYLILNQYLNDEIATLLQRIADLFRQRLQNINIMVIQANRFKIISKDEYYELLSLLTKMKEIVGKQIRLLSSNGYLFDQFEAFVRSNNIGYPVKIPTERCGRCCSKKIDFFDFSKTHSYQLCMRTCPICGIYSIQVGSEKFIQHYSVTNEAGNTAFSIATTGYEFYYFQLYDKTHGTLAYEQFGECGENIRMHTDSLSPDVHSYKVVLFGRDGVVYSHGKFIKEGNNWIYLLSVVSDNLGSSLMTFVLPLIVLDLTGSGIHLSIISSFETLPFLLLGLPFGAIVDRCDVRKVLIRSDAIRFGGYALLAAVLSARSNATVTLIAIYLVTLVIGCTNVFSSVSEITFISYFVSKSDYSKMNSIVYGIQYTAGLLIPLAGGALYSVVPMGLLALICAACFLLSAGAILLMRVGSSKGAGGSGRGANSHRRHPAGAFLSEDQACGSLPACAGRAVQRADREFPERQPRHHAQESELHVGPGRLGHVGYGHGRVGGDLHRQPAEQKLQVRNGPDRELPRPDVLPSPVCGVRQHLRGGGDAVRGGPVPVRAEHHHYHEPAESGRNPLPREGDEHIQGGSDRGQFARFHIRRHPVEHLRPEERRPMVRRRNPDTDHDWYRSLRSSQQRKNHR